MTENEDTVDPEEVTAPTSIAYVGPATAETIADAPFDAAGIATKSVSYEMLVEAGVNPGVAGKLRREHSLAWSLGGDGGSLNQRSSQVRGLQDEERAWVAASTGDWESASESGGSAEADGSGAAEAAEAAWRDRSQPDPVTEVSGIGEKRAEKLADAGITSVRSLATANPQSVADVLGIDEDRIRKWRDAARDQE